MLYPHHAHITYVGVFLKIGRWKLTPRLQNSFGVTKYEAFGINFQMKLNRQQNFKDYGFQTTD